MLTISEVSKLSPYTEPQIRGMIRRGELEPVRVGHRILLPAEELQRVLGPLFRGAA